MKKQYKDRQRLFKPTELNKRLSGTVLRRPNPDVAPIGESPMARFSLTTEVNKLKRTRKCPLCNRTATKRLGKLDFCDDHHKEMRKTYGTTHRRPTAIWVEKYVCSLTPELRIYRDYLVKIH